MQHAPAVLAVLVLLPPLLATAALDATCAPATCGHLLIRYPFWLRGVQAPSCGYPSFDVSCDATGASPPTLNNSYVRLLDIDYGNRSVVAFHSRLAEDSTACRATKFNMSSSLAFSLLTVSRADWELVLCANCSQTPPAGSLPMTCPGSGAWSVYLSQRYEPGGPFLRGTAPAGFNFSVVPVMPGAELTALDDFSGLVRRGFLLEWTVPGDCEACNRSGGQCRYDTGFRCLCPDGRLHPASCARGKSSNRRTIRIVLAAAGGSLLLLCIYVLIWYQKGRELHFLLFKRTSRGNERNIEALISSHGSLAPKRYKLLSPEFDSVKLG